MISLRIEKYDSDGIYIKYCVIKNFQYFINGTPVDQTDPFYALYQPVLDRFLIVVDKLDVAQTLSTLLLTRYPTYVCCVNTADNFETNIIDNEVCDQWTLSDCTDALVEYSLYNTKPILATKLVPCTSAILWNTVKEKQWILFCQYWIRWFNYIKHHAFNYYQTDSILSNILPQDTLEYYPHKIEQQVYNILFFGQDIKQAELEILQVLQSHAPLHNLWKVSGKP